MKKIIFIVLVLVGVGLIYLGVQKESISIDDLAFITAQESYAADTKVTGLTELAATPDGSDILYIVDDPGGTPISKKITVDNLLGSKADALGADDNYVTDAEKVVIGNTSGTNSGDNSANTTYTIGSNTQAWAANLDIWATVTPSANGQSLVSAADYAAMKALLDLEIGTDVQAYDADLTTWAGITPSANIQTFNAAATYQAAVELLESSNWDWTGSNSMGALTFTSTATPPASDGQWRYVSGLAGLTSKTFAFYSTAVQYMLSYPTLPTDSEDDYHLAYDKDTDAMYWRADSTGSGSLGSNLSSTTNDITTDNNTIQFIGNSEDLDFDFVTNGVNITTDTGVLLVDFGAILLASGGIDLSGGSITGLAVGGLPDGTNDNGTMADNSIDSPEYVDGSIDPEHLAPAGNFTSLTGEWATTGELTGKIKIESDADGYSVTGAMAHGGLLVETGNQQTVTLLTAVAGYSFCVIADGADGSAEIYVDCDAGDHFEYDGTTMANGEYIYNDSDLKGDRMCFIAVDADTWIVTYGGDTTVAEETP